MFGCFAATGAKKEFDRVAGFKDTHHSTATTRVYSTAIESVIDGGTLLVELCAMLGFG
jgi:hypothetical protein